MSFNDRREGRKRKCKNDRIGLSTAPCGTRQDIETGTNVNNNLNRDKLDSTRKTTNQGQCVVSKFKNRNNANR